MKEPHDLLAAVFRSDYLPIVKTYIDQLQLVLESYELVVFVARKAYCFFRALQERGLVEKPDGCKVLSSRALTFVHDISERRIALVDDVMITGASAMNAWDALRDLRKDADMYVAALCPDELVREHGSGPRIYAIGELGVEQVHEFAKDITLFIQASGVTNNLDQPVYTVRFSSVDALDELVDQPGWIDLSSPVQRASGIGCATISFNPLRIGGGDSVLRHILHKAILKVRLTRRKGEPLASVVPFVLLPELDSSELISAYRLVALDGLEGYVRSSTSKQTLNNRFRILHFALATYLCRAAMSSWPGVSSFLCDRESEASLFGFEIIPYLRPNSWTPNLSNPEVADVPGELVHWLDYCSALMYSRHLVNVSARGRNMRENLDSGSTVLDLGQPLTGLALHSLEAGGQVSRSFGACRSLISACLDVLIDRGVLVPFLHSQKNAGSYRLVRAYRGGEVMYITEVDLRRFSYLLSRFSGLIGADVDDDTVGRMGVVYLRSRTARSSAAVNGIEPFSLIFSPRDFSYQTKGEDGEGSLLSMMVELELLEKDKGGKIRSLVRGEDEAISGAEKVRLDSNAAFFAGVYTSFVDKNDTVRQYGSFRHVLERMAVGTSDDYSIACLLWQARRVKREIGKGLPANRDAVAYSLDKARYWRSLVIDTEETLSMIVGLASAANVDAASAISLVPSLYPGADARPPSFNMLLNQFDDVIARARSIAESDLSIDNSSIMDFHAAFEIFEEGAKVVTGHLPRRNWARHGGVPVLVEKEILAVACRDRGRGGSRYIFFAGDGYGLEDLESACTSCLEMDLTGVPAVILFVDGTYRPIAILSSATEKITTARVFPKSLREELRIIKLWASRRIDRGAPPVLFVVGRSASIRNCEPTIENAAALCGKEVKPSRMRLNGLRHISERDVRMYRLVSLEDKVQDKSVVYVAKNSIVGSMGSGSHGMVTDSHVHQQISIEKAIDGLKEIDEGLDSAPGFAAEDKALAKQKVKSLLGWISDSETMPSDSDVRSAYWTLNGILQNAASLATVWGAICETIKLFLGI